MSGMTGFQGGIVGLALAAVTVGVAQQNPVPPKPVQAATQAPQAAATQQAAQVHGGTGPRVALTEVSLIDLPRPAAGDIAEVSVFVSNSETSPVPVGAQIVLSDSVTGRPTSVQVEPTAKILEPLGVQPLRLRIPAGQLTGTGVQRGFLQVRAGTGTATTVLPRPIRIAPATRAPRLLDVVIGAGFGVGLLIVAIAWPWKSPPKQAAPLVWSRDSWATNLALVGSALVTFSGLAAPNVVFHHMTRAQYTSLGTLIAGVILLANACYAFAGADRASSGAVPVALFAVLSATLGAALSQLITLGLLVREVYEASVITKALYIATNLVVVVTGLALLAYAYQTTSRLTPKPAAPAPDDHRKAAPWAEGVPAPVGIREWRLP